MIHDFDFLAFVHIAKLIINKTNTMHLPVSQAALPLPGRSTRAPDQLPRLGLQDP